MEFQQKSQRVSLLPSLPFPPGTAARPVPPTAPRMASLTPPERKELWLCQCLCALPTGEGARGVAPAATRTPSPGRAEVVRRGAAAWRGLVAVGRDGVGVLLWVAIGSNGKWGVAVGVTGG